MIEKRQRIRWQINIKVKVRLEGAVRDISCIIHDLNFKGARISLAQQLPEDRPIKMKISLAAGFVFEVEAWVVWHKRVMDKNVYGLYFSKMAEADNSVIFKFMQRDFTKLLGNLKEPVVSEISEKKGWGVEMIDRRVFERFAATVPVNLIDLDAGGELVADTCDVSAKGIGVVSKECLRLGNRLELWLKIKDGGEPLYTRGSVIWSAQQETGEYRGGICLEKAELMGLSRIFRL